MSASLWLRVCPRPRSQAPEEATFQPRINTSSVVLRRLMEKQQGEGEEAGPALVGGDVAARCGERAGAVGL